MYVKKRKVCIKRKELKIKIKSLRGKKGCYMSEDIEIIEERFCECIMVVIGCVVFIVLGYVLGIPLKLFFIPGLLLVLEIGVFIRDYRALKKAGVRDVYRFFIESKGAKDMGSNRYKYITTIIVFLAVIISGYLLKADPVHTLM